MAEVDGGLGTLELAILHGLRPSTHGLRRWFVLLHARREETAASRAVTMRLRPFTM